MLLTAVIHLSQVRERRSAALKAAESTKGMDMATLKEHLLARGLSTIGNWGELRNRVRYGKHSAMAGAVVGDEE